MANRCVNCGSIDTQVGLDMFTCNVCGARSNFDGTPGRTGVDDVQRELLEAQLRGPEPGQGIVGNFADLQKAGNPNHPADTIAEAAAESPAYQQAEAEIKDAEKAPKTSKSTSKK